MTITPISDGALAAIKAGLQVYGPRLDHRTEIRVESLRGLIARLELAEAKYRSLLAIYTRNDPLDAE